MTVVSRRVGHKDLEAVAEGAVSRPDVDSSRESHQEAQARLAVQVQDLAHPIGGRGVLQRQRPDTAGDARLAALEHYADLACQWIGHRYGVATTAP